MDLNIHLNINIQNFDACKSLQDEIFKFKTGKLPDEKDAYSDDSFAFI